MKYVILLTLMLLVSSCSSTITKKNNSLEAISQVTANLAVAQSKSLLVSNVVLSTEYNRQIQLINVKPNEVKSTNFDLIVSQVLNNKYVVDKSMEVELNKTKAELKSYKKWFGLNGVLLGLKQFSRDILYSTIGLSIVFIVLRVFASSSPIISAIWNVFANIFGWLINQFALLCPKLLNSIKNTEQEVVQDWKSLFDKIKNIFIKKKNVPPTNI